MTEFRRSTSALLLAIASLHGIAAGAFAAEPPESETTATAAPPARDVSKRLATELLADATDVPGLVVMRLDRGAPSVVGAAGVLRVGDPGPITIDTPVHLGSCGKAMTATLAMVLARSSTAGGTELAPTPPFSLDLTLGAVLPELVADAPEDVAAWDDASVRDLLSHVAGVTDPTGPAFVRFIARAEAPIDRGGTGGPAPVSHQRRIATALVTAEARGDRRYRYSNMGYVIASAMMERVANERFEELLVARVLEPVGITSAGFGAPTGDDAAWGHRTGPTGDPVAMPPGPFADNRPFMSAAGRMHMTLRDWGRFVHAHVRAARGEDTPILTAAESRELRTVSGTPDGGDRYALGWLVVDDAFCDDETLTHAGSNTMWFAEVFACPSSDIVLLAAANAGTPGARRAVREAISLLAAEIPSTASAPASAP